MGLGFPRQGGLHLCESKSVPCVSHPWKEGPLGLSLVWVQRVGTNN